MLPKPFYNEKGITIYHADCRDLLGELPPFDLLLTDPPYGIGWRTDYARFSKGTTNKKQIQNDKTTPFVDLFFDLTREQMVFGVNTLGLNQKGSLLIWDKRCNNGFSFLSDGEAAYWSRGHGVYIFSLNAQAFRSRSGGLHPTQKPIELMSWCIQKAKNNQKIIDPFMGSGSTLVAAKQLGKTAVGIELDERYCEIAAERVSQNFLF